MAPRVSVAQLKDQLQDLLAKEKLKEALVCYAQLEAAEPNEPRWPHRKGDLQVRMKLPKEAISSYDKAVTLYVGQGFAARGAALAKVVVGLDPTRTDVLAKVDGVGVREARAMHHDAPASGSNPASAEEAARASATSAPGPAPAASPPPAPPAQMAPPAHVASPAAAAAPSAGAPVASVPLPAPPIPSIAPVALPVGSLGHLPGLPALPLAPVPLAAPPLGTAAPAAPAEEPMRHSIVFDAPMLALDEHAEAGERRFADAEAPADFDLDLDDLTIHVDDDDALPGLDDLPDLDALVDMPSIPLFADIPQAALQQMLSLAELVQLDDGGVLIRRGEPAHALYILAEGRAEVHLPGGTAVALAEGEVVGETCLFADMVRGADVVARGPLRALSLDRMALEVLVNQWPDLAGILYDLLTRRLVQNLLRHGALFQPFDLPTRLSISRLFEVRRAAPGVQILAAGMRADAMYVALLGTLDATFPDGRVESVPHGTLLGERSLLGHVPTRVTVAARTEAVVLRLPGHQFQKLIDTYPAVLQHFAETSTRASFEDVDTHDLRVTY